MFFGGQDIISSITNLGSLTNALNTPGFSSLDQTFSSMLPANITSFDSQGVASILNPSNLEQLVTTQFESIASDFVGQAESVLQSALGNFSISPQGFNIFSQFDGLIGQLRQIADQFSITSADQMLQVLGNNIQVDQLGQITQNAFSSFSNQQFSPRQIRDLANPNNFTASKNNLVSTAQTTAINKTTNYLETQGSNPVFTNNGARGLQQQSNPQFSGDNQNGKELYVRRTVYWAKGSGTDSDSAAFRSSTGRRLQEGVSAAVDPRTIPYLSRIEFPDIGTRYAVDTGGAVKSRKASGGREPVGDVFFTTREIALAFVRSSPPYVTVRVFPPQTKYKYVKNAPPTYGTA